MSSSLSAELILFQARHIPGLTNVLADHPSRQQIQQFLHKFSHNKLGGMPLQRGQLPRFAIHSFPDSMTTLGQRW